MTQTVATPNHPPVPHPPEAAKADPFEFLSAEAIQELRDAQKAHLQRAVDTVNPYDVVGQKRAEAQAQGDFDDLRIEYLQDKWGIEESDPRYDEYFDVISQASVDNMTDREWMSGEFDADGNKVNPSGRQMLNELHDKELDDYRQTLPPPVLPPAPAALTQPLHTPEQLRDFADKKEACDNARRDLMIARDELARLTVKRQGKLVDRQSPEYRAAHKAYNDSLIAYGKAGEAMKDASNHGRTDVERSADVTEFLLHEAAELRRITNEKWDNTKVNKICKWMARGNVAQRIAKGVLVGGAVAGATAIITAATAGTGTVGILAGGAATAGGVLARGMRAYGATRGRELLAGHEHTTMTGTGRHGERDTIDYQFERDVYADIAGATSAERGLGLALDRLHAGHERAIQHEQRQNRLSVGIGALATVLGAGVASGAALAAEHTGLTDKLAGGWDRIRGLFGHDSGSAGSPNGSPETPKAPETPGGQPETPETPDKPSTTGETPETPSTPRTPGETSIPPNAIPDGLDQEATERYKEAYEAMATVDKGMGGIELFNEMGLSASDWYQHEDALLKAHPEDFYRMPDGHVGLSHPGKLSNDAMLDIAQRTGILPK